MKTIVFKGQNYHCNDHETLLNSFLRQGAEIQFSCRNGICHHCMLRCIKGHIPEKSQPGISPELKAKGYFLPCKCHPDDDMHITVPQKADYFFIAVVTEKTKLADNIIRILLKPKHKYSCPTAQSINLLQPEGTISSYTVNTVSEIDNSLELHILCHPDTNPNTFLCDNVMVGDKLSIQATERKIESDKIKQNKSLLPADPKLWQALNEGKLLKTILDDFYTQLFLDPFLAPFFHGVTRQRAMEKQFSFMRQLISGERIYFGDRPRNAHHWMVISHELFDYREQLMTATLRKYGLSETMVKRWRAFEEQFRDDIVKTEPRKKKIGNSELPLDGYQETRLDVGSLCDSCGLEVSAGVKVRYHLRLGTLYCPDCMNPDSAVDRSK